MSWQEMKELPKKQKKQKPRDTSCGLTHQGAYPDVIVGGADGGVVNILFRTSLRSEDNIKQDECWNTFSIWAVSSNTTVPQQKQPV